MYEYRAKVIRVYDGDTITVDIDLGFGITFHKQTIRLYGINTPEIRTKDPHEKLKGYDARDYLRSLILRKQVVIRTFKDKKGKYGRWLAVVELDAVVNINEKMVEAGHAEYIKF